MKTLEENLFSSRVSFAFQTVLRTARPMQSVGQPRNGGLRYRNLLQTAAWEISMQPFLVLFLGFKRERPRP